MENILAPYSLKTRLKERLWCIFSKVGDYTHSIPFLSGKLRNLHSNLDFLGQLVSEINFKFSCHLIFFWAIQRILYNQNQLSVLLHISTVYCCTWN